MIFIKARKNKGCYVWAMNYSFEKNAGLSLIIFTILLVFTMVLHPAGGSMEHLMKITRVIAITHAIAILSLPFGWAGFWGLTKKLGTGNFLSVLAFAFVSLGLIAALMAAAANGLVLPIFLGHNRNASPEIIESFRPVLHYGFAINHAFDYVYTGAFCLAILFWSIAILRSKKLALWIGWTGIAVAAAIAIVFIAGVTVNNLHGLRIFIIAIILWILAVGSAMFKSLQDRP